MTGLRAFFMASMIGSSWDTCVQRVRDCKSVGMVKKKLEKKSGHDINNLSACIFYCLGDVLKLGHLRA